MVRKYMPEINEPKFKWQDAVALVGVLLALAAMTDIPLLLRMAFFALSAICFPLSFASHTRWPYWTRWAISIVCVCALAFVALSVYKRALEPAAKPATPPMQAQISVTKMAGGFLKQQKTGQEGFTVNVYFRNSGTAATGKVSHRTVLVSSLEPLTPEQIAENQRTAREPIHPDTGGVIAEMEPNGPELFYSTPNDDAGLVQVAREAQRVLNGRKIFYLFIGFRYRDADLPAGKVRLTELCRWAQGSFDAWHFCGVNRTVVLDGEEP